jgi:hypothetical protein
MADDYELGTVGPIPTVNPNVAKIGEMLKLAKKYADQYYVKDYVPLIGGTTLGEFLLGKAPEEIERWGQGDYPLRNPNEVVRTGGNRLDVWKTDRFQPTFDVATNVVAPLAGFAKATKGMPVGASIMGPESNLWKPEMAFQAGKMEAKGAKADEILEATGMVRGLDNQWRTELSDQFAKLKGEGDTFGTRHATVHPANDRFTSPERRAEGALVEDILDHPQLFEAYPELAKIKVEAHGSTRGEKGSYSQSKNTISLREDLSPEQAKSTLLHELTHGIQAKEQFNRGANYKEQVFKYAQQKENLIKQIEDLNKEASTALNAGDKAKYDELMIQRDDLGMQYIKINPEKQGYEDYLKHGGEAEARMVQNRMDLSPEQLRQYFPYQKGAKEYGLDINPDEAIITTQHPGTINQPSQSLEIKGYQDEGNFRRVGEPQSNLEKFGIAGNEQRGLPGGLIENAGRITRGSNPDDIAKQAEYIQANLSNPQFNKALALAQKHNPEFDLQAIKDMPESSVAKQHSIARTYDLLTKESVSPQLKNAIFDDYMAKHPEMMKKEGIKDYDDLVEKSYGQLRKEIDQQFDDMVKGGMKLSYHQGDANYLDSKEMLRDALVNNHLYTYRGGDVHPLLNDMDEFYGLNSNEKFRAVHDYLGHGTTGSQFGRKGEEIAYGAHAQTLSPLARIAAAAETRGQNSFVNYSGVNADLQEKMMSTRIARDQAIHRGESPDQYDAILRDLGGQWQYAKQQGVALPPDMLEAGYKGEMPDYIKGNLFPEHGVSHKGYHYSNLSDLEETDPAKYGYGIRGAEAKRLALPGSIKERTYFYNEPGMREPGLGRNQYEADLNHFYDTENDPAGIIRMADNFNRDKNGILDAAGKANDIERMMREAGYHGYFNNNTGVGISFEPQKVREYSRE